MTEEQKQNLARAVDLLRTATATIDTAATRLEQLKAQGVGLVVLPGDVRDLARQARDLTDLAAEIAAIAMDDS